MVTSPAAYLHDLNPFLIRLSGNVGVRWYGLSYVAGFIAAWLVVRWLARRGATPLSPQRVGDLVLAVAVGTIVGGRVGYCVFYEPGLLVDFSGDFPFWGLLALNRGGMASHGGIIGIVLACMIHARRAEAPLTHLLDLTAWSGMLGILFGRIANFVNGELYGRPCSPDLPWAVKFPQEMRDWSADRLADLGPAAEALGQTSAEWGRNVSLMDVDGAARGWVYGMVTEMIQRVQAHDPTMIAALRPVLTPRHPSQLYEAAMEGLFMFVALGLIWMKPRKPGVIGGWFMVLYAVVRIIGEQFRTPDAHIGFQALGLTRGQWLSIVMLAAGIVMLTIWSRSKAAPMGGWLRPVGRIEKG